jgi:succinoglycan biosynthesis transport protein ExoP
MNAGAKKHAIELFKGKFQRMEPLDYYNKDENGLNELLRSMQYDERNLREDLLIVRDEDSDFISVGL